jgi:hypothetical protein
MHLSYRDPAVREYCYSLNPDLSNVPFTSEEIALIRAHIADLRSAPSLSDAPINFSIEYGEGVYKFVIVSFGEIRIICSIISQISKPTPSQIKRVQIVDIVRIDLQIINLKAYIS